MAVAEVLWEREGVLAGAGRVLEATAAGHAGSLLVIGDAGLGKTSVLEHACGLAEEQGFFVGVGRGNAMESALPFGVFAQAFDSLGGRGVFDQEGDDRRGPDARAARFYAARRWLSRCDGPVLVVLDDLQWADADSLALLSFLCRRLGSLSVAVIGAMRPYPPVAEELGRVLAHDRYVSIERLAPLTETAAGELLEARVGRPLGVEAIGQAWDACAGNPLLLEQVALAIGRGEDVPESGQAASSVSKELLLARFAGLPVEGMRCAQAAAVLGTRFRPGLAAQLAQVNDNEADGALDALGRSGLVRRAQAGGVEFVHPLFRQALYDDLGGPRQARMHAQAFALLRQRGLEAEAAEHAIRGDLAGDREAVALLARVGRAALGAGAVETAITILEAAADLAAANATPELLLDLGEALTSGGRPEQAIAVCERVLATVDVPTMTRAQALRLLARALVYTGAYQAAAGRFEESAQLATALDPDFAVQTLVAYASESWFFVGPAKVLSVTSWARELAPACTERVRRQAEAAWGLSALGTGNPEGLELCAAAARAVEADPLSVAADVSTSWGALVTYGLAAKYAERLADSEHVHGTALREAERLGIAEEQAWIAVTIAETLVRVLRLDDALELIERAAQLSDLVPVSEPFAAVARALVLLLAGHLEESEAWCRQAQPIVRALDVWTASRWLSYILAWRRLCDGRFAEACQLYADLEATTLRAGLGEPCEVPWARHAITAYIANGREHDARRVITWLEGCADSLPCRWPRIAAATGRARLAESASDPDTADRLFEHAMRLHEEVDLPLERFQTLLEYGKYLRRDGQVRRARPLLAEALEIAEQSGAAWLAGQAKDELRIAGGRRRRRPEDPKRLTAQEHRVATLAATGASTSEIARQLYLSPSTIDTHLEHIYAKLEIHSRRELMNMRDAVSVQDAGGFGSSGPPPAG